MPQIASVSLVAELASARISFINICADIYSIKPIIHQENMLNNLFSVVYTITVGD